ncbi:hypothetical protein TESG_08299 [Trichophyton tonsurans CBS 112818]|uniref:Uncharacterized protein n=1 Tax=Trichophyton tonsurans (strain CBS 112818) TaxID=647933 RepID=F2RQZ6_TRIT1|nr:hypothetical protein TESG_08299 [Trichophyton tonsurans CBS 112818]
MATTLLEYLTQPNPVVDNSNSLKGFPTKCVPKEDIQVVNWDDFTYETLMSCYGAVLATQFNRPLPEISPPLCRIEGEVIDEDSLDHLLTRSISSIVNESLRIAWRGYYSDYPNLVIDMTRGSRARASQNNPAAPRPPHDRQQSSSASTDHTPVFPDWAGVQADLGPVSHLNRCPGDTKLSSKWQSDTDMDKEYHDWPYAQLIKYCGETWNTRYGYLITDKELVVLRISRAMIPQSYRDDGRGGEYRPVEMKSIPWNNSGKGKLTVKLSLWWIHMMAAAPECDTTIGPEYPPIDAWVPRLQEGGYRHTTTGLFSKKLPKNAKEISPRRAARGIVTPPRQRQPSGSPPEGHHSSPNQQSPQHPTKEEITDIRWIPERSRWQYRTRRGSVGLMRHGDPIWSSDGGYYYILPTREGGSRWVRAESEEEEDEEEEEDDDIDENESSRYRRH